MIHTKSLPSKFSFLYLRRAKGVHERVRLGTTLDLYKHVLICMGEIKEESWNNNEAEKYYRRSLKQRPGDRDIGALLTRSAWAHLDNLRGLKLLRIGDGLRQRGEYDVATSAYELAKLFFSSAEKSETICPRMFTYEMNLREVRRNLRAMKKLVN